VECYRHQAIIVGSGSKETEKLALSLPVGVCLRWSMLRRYVAWNHQTTRSYLNLVPEKIWAWLSFDKVAALMARVTFFCLRFQGVLKTRSSSRATTHTVGRTQAIEIRTCRCSFDRSNVHQG
jgi:hypothetical protein